MTAKLSDFKIGDLVILLDSKRARPESIGKQFRVIGIDPNWGVKLDLGYDSWFLEPFKLAPAKRKKITL